MIWVLVLFLICIAFGCYVAYKEAKHHELHKMRAAFEDKKHDIETLIAKEDDKENKEILKGELLGFEKAVEMLEKDDVNNDLIEEIKKDVEELKKKIENIF